MFPFLVKGTVEITQYMCDTETYDDIRIVMATNEDEALQKFENFWSCKTDEYSVYYHASGTVMETIL